MTGNHNIPHTWLSTTLEGVAEVHDALREPVNADERATRVGPYPYYGATGQVGCIDDYLMDGEYVLLGEDGAPFLDPSKPKAYLVSGKSWVNNHAHVLRGIHNVCMNRYLLHALNHADYRGFANGTTRLKLTQAAMRRLPIRLAPLREQKRVVDKIEELFSDLDAGVAALERVRANLKRYRASVLKAAVEGRLTEKWRNANPSVEPATKLLERILTERRKKWEEQQLAKFADAGKSLPKNWRDKYEEPAPPDPSNLPELPKGWCWATLDQMSHLTGGVTKGQKRRNDEVVRLIPYLRVANVQRGFLDLAEMKTIEATEDDITELRLLPGDVLFTEGGDRDKLGRGWVWNGELEECIHQNHIFRARLLSVDVAPKYVSWCGNSYGRLWFQKAGRQTVNLASINLTILRRFPVPLPPADEQRFIVAEIETRLSVVEESQRQVAANGLRSSRLRQSILKRAFEGKLVPQDPKDEPASVLLGRIRAGREAAPHRRDARPPRAAQSPEAAARRTGGGGVKAARSRNVLPKR